MYENLSLLHEYLIHISCVCVRERERARKREKRRERGRKGIFLSFTCHCNTHKALLCGILIIIANPEYKSLSAKHTE